MPTYEYICESCGYIFETFQAMSDMPLEKCPQYGEVVKRLIGKGMAVLFKGRGSDADYQKGGLSDRTCCGREGRCETPPCSDGGVCRR
ncbi:MAG: zinc ribbon domain-containing protein [Candidatus Omnitrophica bacterium]|nr:zinc ribbon domain-containing protein [Candidatus Omnitrophota bacterium]